MQQEIFEAGTAASGTTTRRSAHSRQQTPDRFASMRRFDKLAWETQHNDEHRALEYARRALNLRESLGNSHGIHRSLVVLARDHSRLQENDAALRLVEQALPDARAAADHACLEMIFRLRAEIAIRLRHFDEAHACLDRCRAIALEHNKNPLNGELVRVSLLVGENKLAAAVETCEKLLRQAEKSGRLVQAAQAATHLCAIHRIVGDWRATREFGRRALELNETFKLHRNQVSVLIALTECAVADDDFDQAEELCARAEALCLANNLRVDRAGVLVSRASTLLLLQRPDEADDQLREARRLVAGMVDKINAALLMLAGEAALQRGDAAAAEREFEKALQAEPPLAEFDRWQVHHGLAEVYEKSGRAEAALQQHRLYLAMYERTRGFDVRRRISMIEQRYEMRRAEAERELLRCRIDELNAAVQSANSELAELALNSAQRRAGLEQLRESIAKELQSAPQDVRTFLQSMHSTVAELMAEGETPTAFSEQFDRIHAGFTQRLAREYPGLSPAEIHICTLMRVGLRSKDIADTLHVSTHTVNTHRQNIRKKMNLGRGANLSALLTAL